MKEKELVYNGKKENKILKFIIFLFIIFMVFLSTCVRVYCILFKFFDNLVTPHIFIKKEIITIFLILFCGLEMSKCIIIYKFNDSHFGYQILYILALICFSASLVFKLVDLVGFSSLLLSTICLYETMEELDKNLLFSVNVLMTFLSGVFTIFFYTMCLVN